MKKLETFDFRGKSHFEDDDKQNWLVFRPIQKYFKTFSTTDSNIKWWKHKWSSDESIKRPVTSNKLVNASLDFVGTKARVKFRFLGLPYPRKLFVWCSQINKTRWYWSV